MTLEEIKTCDKDFLTPEDVREVLGCMPYTINVQAKQDASKLGFAVSVMGSRIKIPRLAFIHWMTYGNAPVITGDERRADDAEHYHSACSGLRGWGGFRAADYQTTRCEEAK